MSKHYFFYDESEHSRKISYKTVSALNYYDNFIAMIVGWNDSKDDILQRYLVFETAYTDRKDRNGEIKSTMLSQKQFQYGFASLNKQNAQFVSDFLSLFDETNHVYFSVSSKIEYLVLQLFQGYNNNLLVDADLMKYSITKALVIYRPQEIIRCLYESPERFIEELKTFFQNRIDINKNHSDLKQAESKAFQDILLILEDISDPPVLDWDYHMPFDGFTKYLKEKNIHDYVLIIDKEGDPEKESKTLNTARSIGLENSYEADSTKYPGLRISDMLAGIISKLLKGLCDSLRYQSVEDGINKKVLDPTWFNLSEEQLNLYKNLYRLICEWQPAWYKSYAGIYSDDLVVFNALLFEPKIAYSDIKLERDKMEIPQKEDFSQNNGCFSRIDAMLKVYETMQLTKKGSPALRNAFEYNKLPSVVMSCVDILLKDGFPYSAIKNSLKLKEYDKLLKLSMSTPPKLRMKILKWRFVPKLYKP